MKKRPVEDPSISQCVGNRVSSSTFSVTSCLTSSAASKMRLLASLALAVAIASAQAGKNRNTPFPTNFVKQHFLKTNLLPSILFPRVRSLLNCVVRKSLFLVVSLCPCFLFPRLQKKPFSCSNPQAPFHPHRQTKPLAFPPCDVTGRGRPMAAEAVGGPASTSVLIGLGLRLRRLLLGVGSPPPTVAPPPKQRGGGTGWVAIVGSCF